MKKQIITYVCAAVLVVPGLVMAQASVTLPGQTPPTLPLGGTREGVNPIRGMNTEAIKNIFPGNINKEQEQRNEEMKRLQENKREEVKQVRENEKEETKQAREVRQEEMKQVREIKQQEVKQLREGNQEAMKKAQESFRSEIKKTQEDFRNEMGTVRASIKESATGTIRELQQRREEFKATVEIKREGFKQELETKREEAKKQMEVKREEAKKQIEAIKDTNKKEAVKRVDTNLSDTNTRMTNQFTKNLDQMDSVVLNIISRADKAEVHGLGIESVRTAIATAQKAITDARALVIAQASKTYTVTIQDPNAPRVDVQNMRDALKKDLKAVQDGVRAAHDAIRVSATTLAQIPRINETDVTPTSSPIVPSGTSTQ
ncbi:MAG: hypothetical protein WCV80_01825 [Candidatus Paceibacterota bacterium]|jgi:hypothetical protein